MIIGFSASCLIRTRGQFSAKRRLYKLIDNCKLTVYIRAMKRGNDREVSTRRDFKLLFEEARVSIRSMSRRSKTFSACST